MKRPFVATLILLGSLLAPLAASAGQIHALVTDFAISPAESSGLKSTLKILLSSRISGDGISTVESPAEAEVIISGSFTQLGKVFSLDASAKTVAGKQLATAFEQGESLDSLIPALGKVSAKLKADILKGYSQPGTAASRPAEEKGSDSQIVRQEKTAGWNSQRIAGVQSFLAPGGAKQYFIANDDVIRLMRQGTTLETVCEAKIPSRMKILGIDSFPYGEGKMLLSVTLTDVDWISSRIYLLENGALKLVAQDLPYYFRGMSLAGGEKKLYAQSTGRSEDYYGDLFEAVYLDGTVKLKNPIKLPRFANIFNYNEFRDQAGKTFTTALSESGYLIVYSDKGEELWRSNDKFGGSETCFQRRDSEKERLTGQPFRTRFIDQRITVTEKGEVLLPQNGGFFVLGDARSYGNYSMVSLAWNGSSMEERWRTKLVKSYLADYFYEAGSQDLVLMEVVQKESLFGKGGSALRVVRAE